MNDAAPITRQIEPELLELLGSFIVKWSFVEVCVSDLFVLLTRGDPGCMLVVTGTTSADTITKWIRALIESHKKTPHDLVNEINEALSEVDRIRSERNTLVHGLWVTTGPENSVIVSTANLGRNEVIRELVVTAADIRVLIDDTLEVAGKLRALVKNIVPMG
jgi:hypothetical protein